MQSETGTAEPALLRARGVPQSATGPIGVCSLVVLHVLDLRIAPQPVELPVLALDRAHAAGIARTDIDGTDLFALVAALAWLYDQPSLAPRADHLFGVISGAILTGQAGSGVSQERPRPAAEIL